MSSGDRLLLILHLGFAIFAVCSVILSLDPFSGSKGALWLIGWRVVQAVGGSMLMANSAAIITDAFPAKERGMALGINIVAALAGWMSLTTGLLLNEGSAALIILNGLRMLRPGRGETRRARTSVSV